MEKANIPEHDCKEHLDCGCRCRICGAVVHQYQCDDDGTFAASGKVATTWCTRCGKKERFYSDSGNVIESDFE